MGVVFTNGIPETKEKIMSIYFTDSDCEIWWTDVDKYKINFLPMPYSVNGKEYAYDMGRNTDFHALYELTRKGAMPTTSALNPNDYVEAFEPFLKKGEDILYVHFSSELSGTFDHLKVAMVELKEKYPDRTIRTFDTKSICYGGGVVALEGAKLHAMGFSDDEIIGRLEVLKKKVRIEFMVDSLSHLRRGGRVSAATAIFGSMLNIKPILCCGQDGKLVKLTTQKGKIKSMNYIADHVCDTYDFDMDQELYIMDADDPELAEKAQEIITSKMGDKVKIRRLPIGPVIGAHCGPGTVGMVWFAR